VKSSRKGKKISALTRYEPFIFAITHLKSKHISQYAIHKIMIFPPDDDAKENNM